MSYPYLARTTLRYKSPHATDLSFAKDETIRVTGPSPEDEDWLLGETLDGAKSGGFPKDFITPIEGDATSSDATPSSTDASAPVAEDPAPPPVPASAPAPPSPKLEPASLPPSNSATPAPAVPPLTTGVPPPAAKPTPAPAPAPASVPETAASSSGDAEPAHKSMKDRLAFFAAAQTKAAPPPVKPRPAAAGGLTWSQRQKMRQEQEAKEGGSTEPTTSSTPAAVPASASSGAPITGPTSSSDTINVAASSPDIAKPKNDGAGLSAADAQSSISKGGSLRERMAALQGAGAFGQTEDKPPAPATTGKTWKRPPAPPQSEPEEGEETNETTEGAVKRPSMETGTGDEVEVPEGQEGLATAEVPEQTEEEEEKARRAAIAARMAKLGARGPMGMAIPPKPAMKPTMKPKPQSPSVEKAEPIHPREEVIEAEALSPPSPVSAASAAAATSTSTSTSTSPPSSIPMPAIARKTAPPRRKPAPSSTPTTETAGPQRRMEGVGPDNCREPPAQVMVAGEEEPLPKTEKQLAKEREDEQVGRGPHGAEGAAAAGIALLPADCGQDAEADDHHDSEEHIPSQTQDRDHGEDGADEPDVSERTGVPTMVPIHPPAVVEADDQIVDDEDENEDVPPPPPPRMTLANMPKDELELKHEHDATHAEQEQERYAESDHRRNDEDEDKEAGVPPPPPARPLGPRPVPSPLANTPQRLLPPPPQHYVQQEEEEARSSANREEDEPAPPPPPRRQPSTSMPSHSGAHGAVEQSPSSPVTTKNSSSPSTAMPIVPRSPVRSTSQTDEPNMPVDDDAARRSGIAARMAKLGGIKFGMPPPTFEKRSDSMGPGADTDTPQTSTSPIQEKSFQQTSGPADQEQREQETSPALAHQRPAMTSAGDDAETPDAEAARRRATLARLRAGGAVGFDMFGHGPQATSVEDERGLQEELQHYQAEQDTPPAVPTRQQPASPGLDRDEDEGEEGPPPPPPNRPPVPTNRSSLPPPPTSSHSESRYPEEEEDVPPPPPPPGRPPIPTTQSSMPPLPRETEVIPPPSPSRMTGGPPSPSISMNRPQVLTDRAVPPPAGPPAMGLAQPLGRVVDEPSSMNSPTFHSPSSLMSASAQPQYTSSPTGEMPHPRRSASIASRSSGQFGMSPASRQASRADLSSEPRQSYSQEQPRQSMNQGRPAFNELQEAAGTSGARLYRSAKGLFEQGKRAYLGDGSSAGFVLVAIDQAQLPRPQGEWGQVVLEQEGASVLKRYDEARPGDIAAFYDAKLKGKKGLSSYNQHVGSVQEPLVGIISESEAKKHKLRVLQVERGVPEEVSYRCDDLKSGRIVVYRPGI